MDLFEINFHFVKNYGAFLQAYVLQRKVEAKIINFCPGKFYYRFVGEASLKKHPVLGLLLNLVRYCRFRIGQGLCFPEFRKLNKTKKISSLTSVKKLHLANDADYLVGSDQVWNPRFIFRRENFYFLNFTPDNAKRISYAASLGMKEWPKPFEQKVLPMLKRFDAISVREESAVSYLTSLGLKNVVCVCDPTILHKGDFYRKEFPYENVEEEFSFVYRIREVIPDAVQNILLPQNREIWLSKPRRWRLPSVTQWLQNIDNAKFVVTDSFHCAVFCILFHKPFLVIPNRSTGKGMNERFATLLGKTGLEYRSLTCEESSEEVLQKLNAPVDWEKVDAILEDWRTYSADWLEKALGE